MLLIILVWWWGSSLWISNLVWHLMGYLSLFWSHIWVRHIRPGWVIHLRMEIHVCLGRNLLHHIWHFNNLFKLRVIDSLHLKHRCAWLFLLLLGSCLRVLLFELLNLFICLCLNISFLITRISPSNLSSSWGSLLLVLSRVNNIHLIRIITRYRLGWLALLCG